MYHILQDWAFSTTPAPFTSQTSDGVAAVLHRWSIVEHVHPLFTLMLCLCNRHIASHFFIPGSGDEVVLLDLRFNARFQRVAGKFVLAQIFPLLKSSR